jgi:thiol-disulfide isomerase/thioredoxin
MNCRNDSLTFRRRLFPTLLLLLLLLNPSFLAHASTTKANQAKLVQCPPLDRKELATKIQKHGPQKLVFFSTWCGDCVAHLKQSSKGSPETFIAIVAFDSRERAENSLSKMGMDIPCAMDDGIAKLLGVKVVPAERLLNVAELAKLGDLKAH